MGRGLGVLSNCRNTLDLLNDRAQMIIDTIEGPSSE